uniref:Uncharacterized protein n=1 Tax=Panagrolaimus sp. PS1159 TaxID=55785 RepID=A0AC35G0K1_9BILA
MMCNDSNSGGFHRKTAPAAKAKQLKLLPNERQFVPDRISGDVPFHLYRSAFLSPKRYLEFLKKLEQSSSRHDFLFWVFDIVAAGRSTDQSVRTITANDLNDFFADPEKKGFVYINRVIASATKGSIDGSIPCSSFSEYLLKTYPEIFKPHLYEDQQNPSFTTYPNTPELYEYRSKAFLSLTKEHFYLANHDEYVSLFLIGITVVELEGYGQQYLY